MKVHPQRANPVDERAWESRNVDRAEHVPRLQFLLVSDLVGFTATVQALGDYRGLEYIREHNLLLRACLQRCAGREIAHTGDGMIMSFCSPQMVLRCATLIQRSLAERNARSPQLPMLVRLGVHVGNPHSDEDRLFGTCVNVAVRVCGVAMPEQVLISEAVWSRLADQRYPLSDRGMVALKGVHEPVQVYELDWRQVELRSCQELGAAA